MDFRLLLKAGDILLRDRDIYSVLGTSTQSCGQLLRARDNYSGLGTSTQGWGHLLRAGDIYSRAGDIYSGTLERFVFGRRSLGVAAVSSTAGRRTSASPDTGCVTAMPTAWMDQMKSTAR